MVSAAYLTNNGNGLHTSSLNVNHAIANESSVGELTTSLQALTIFLSKACMVKQSLTLILNLAFSLPFQRN